MRVYLSGPISGDPEHRARFAEAADLIRARGDEPVDPHDVPPACDDLSCLDKGSTNPAQHGTHTWDCYMRGDIAVLMTCDSVALLRRWDKSPGATLEQFIARTVRIPVEELYA